MNPCPRPADDAFWPNSAAEKTPVTARRSCKPPPKSKTLLIFYVNDCSAGTIFVRNKNCQEIGLPIIKTTWKGKCLELHAA